MKRKDYVRLLILRTVGNFLILFMLFGVVATFGPALYYEAAFRIEKLQGIRYKVAQVETVSEFGKLLEKYKGTNSVNSPSYFGEILKGPHEKILVPPNVDFSIVVPKIGASEGVTANVDPSNKDEYLQVLMRSIAHAKGTSFPGLGGTTYLFAHSADNFWDVGRYNAVFYLLKELESGDDVYLFFQGKRFNYTVYDKKIIDAEDTTLIDSKSDMGERVILQTCWPPGTAWKRMIIFAKPKNQ
ncbi:MAG: hypothetical protein COX79_01340 [Candidatus Levybacteria bacterium CG_4_10_14_0_2_um_filter_36_16]|nr:MAG: hypothetical protein AUK12_02915 [Candidatus Levybacteria bacterium CG2_30_37_29]PIZ97676.1 MAG: hypothetical protein COX79_01340 [Candidatus Levybacteria bacterium CG_4_10_14_0_2_um_filter_36_16]PJA90799.1 MAG: hypothetical protein CO136_00490 [Candidatus Levybacteria bacterium CG_4_9_14_3_um_filter_36_7]